MQPSFIHLRAHSEYSLVDGLLRIKPLVKAVRNLGMPALALTDQNNLFAAVKFYKAAQAAGIKPIIGVDIWLMQAQEQVLTRLTLLCLNQQGYANLTQLISRSYLEGQQGGKAIVHKEWLAGNTEGLIALSGGQEGDIGRALLAGQPKQAQELLHEWLSLFPNNYYLELQRLGREDEEAYIQAAISLASEQQVPVVATNDVRFLAAEDFDAHEARVCINQGYTLADPRRPKIYTPQQFLRSPIEMAKLFDDIPEALQNTLEIAKRCNAEIQLGKSFLPNFPMPADASLSDYFNQQAKSGLEQRLQLLFDSEEELAKQQEKYNQRLEQELTVINSMGFQGYFLIVADFIRWAKLNGVPVGPGRGSGPGSLVAYALQITDLDPLAYDLLFERFLNPERVSMPDFDVDFCMDGRDKVIDYVAQTYGRNSVSQIITYGTMAAKAVVRDVGRVLAHPYGFVDKIAKLIPFELGITLEKALAQEEELAKRYQEEEEVRSLLDLARKLEGITRNAGKHAGGVVISPSLLTDFAPLYCEPDGSNLITQFDKDDIEAVGLVKFDFLGLRTLTIIDWTVRAINQKRQSIGEPLLDILRIPLADEQTFNLLKACNTTAVFQLESRGMKDLIKRLQPDSFEDIIALVALFRPGPLQSGMVDDFIDRKHGRAKVDYPHPDLEPVLRPTYGVILYQEQVMQIAQVLAGYTLGGADLLRRAMGKKKPEEMAKQREIFTQGAIARGVTGDTATYIFDLMEKFAGYGFNKSHSAAYALLSYQTAWLKANYPAEFMAAVLSSDMDNTDKVVLLINECRQMELNILPPHINHSHIRFTVADEKTICYGLGALKGAGEAALTGLMQEREKNGHYQDLFDLCQRNELRKLNRRVFEALINAGALDGLAANRASLMASFSAALQAAEKQNQEQSLGQVNLFSDSGKPQPICVPEWSLTQFLAGEKAALGLYFSGHPVQAYAQELKEFCTVKIANIASVRRQSIVLAGIVAGLRTMFTKRGDRMAFVTLEDDSGRLDITLFAELFNKAKPLLTKDNLLIVSGEVQIDEYTGGYKMACSTILNLIQAREHYAKYLTLNIKMQQMKGNFIQNLTAVLHPNKGGACRIIVDYQADKVCARLALGDSWQITPSDDLLAGLRGLIGEQAVKLCY